MYHEYVVDVISFVFFLLTTCIEFLMLLFVPHDNRILGFNTVLKDNYYTSTDINIRLCSHILCSHPINHFILTFDKASLVERQCAIKS